MGVAFTFPGQGSQSVGMGRELYEQFSQARLVFEEIDDALGEKLSTLIFNGPEEELTLTANAQPALMAVSMAIIRVMEAQGFVLEDKISYVAGHSLGEYCALCASGMFSLADTAQLLRLRGEAMQVAVPVGLGAMAAIIGLDEGQVLDLCEEASAFGECQIANDNGGGQLVVSGIQAAVEQVVIRAREKQAKRALMLPVSAPFHSRLKQPEEQYISNALTDVNKQDPTVPLIANVLARPVQDSDLITQLLVEQVIGRVRWRETIDFLASNDIDEIYEIGNGRVLSGLSRRISKDIKAISVGGSQEIESTLESLKV